MTGATRYFCPLDCGWHYDRPGLDLANPDRLYPIADIPVPDGIDPSAYQLAAAELLNVEATVKQHLDTHELIEWVQAVERLKIERNQLAAELERQPLFTCGASHVNDLGAAGPCVLRYRHDGAVHEDVQGCRWWETTSHATGTTNSQ